MLRSNWIYIHIPLVFLGYTALFLAFAAAMMYLLQERELKSKRPTMFHNRLPSLEICDDLAYKSLAIGFPLITLGNRFRSPLGANGVGQRVGSRHKVMLSFVTWFVYLLLIHYRLIAGWRGRKRPTLRSSVSSVCY